MTTIFTVGHSTHPIDEFVEIVRAHGVDFIADVRTIAKSRHNPQFGEDALRESLPERGIAYRRLTALGGLRHSKSGSPNGAWRNASFRGYADYMQTDEFAAAVDQLIELAGQKTVAVMCAEVLPWRCHRSLIGDALLVRGVEVLDIMSARQAKPEKVTSFAHVDGTTITYPPEQDAAPTLARL